MTPKGVMPPHMTPERNPIAVRDTEVGGHRGSYKVNFINYV